MQALRLRLAENRLNVAQDDNIFVIGTLEAG